MCLGNECSPTENININISFRSFIFIQTYVNMELSDISSRSKEFCLSLGYQNEEALNLHKSSFGGENVVITKDTYAKAYSPNQDHRGLPQNRATVTHKSV